MTMQLKRIALAVLLTVGMILPSVAVAQKLEPLPIDPAVKMGTLPNGLTYIIRKNAEPKGRAHYYIAQKVGSILEDESQLGLAHFLEHMAFNGTKNFPGKNLISFLERIGCRFGADLNAYTSFDETVYTIMDAPTNQGKEIIDSCILIMHDWSNNISLDHKEIDEERGVIQEEWRMRNTAGYRSMVEMINKLLPGNKYAKRMPIGTMDVVMNFPYKAIEDFYHKWYRPDLQGIIIVGDIDPDYVESKIKEYFADVPKPQNPAERYYVPVEDNKEPINALVTDKETQATQVLVMFKHDVKSPEIKASAMGAFINYVNAVMSQVMSERFQAITKKPGAPFMGAGVYDGEYSGVARTKDALTFVAVAKDGHSQQALEALAVEAKRLKEHGILAAEYDRARRNILKNYEDMYKERDKRSNSAYIEEYKDYFLHGGYIPGIEMEKMIMDQVASSLTLEQVNDMIKSYIPNNVGENLAVSVSGPEKAGIKYPAENQLSKIFIDTFNKPTEALKEEVSNEKLLDKDPVSGKIVDEKKNQKFGATLLTLDNGVKVFLLPTNYKDDEIRMRGIAHGGTKLYKSEVDQLTSKVLDNIVELGGLGKFDKLELSKALTGRSANVSLSISDFTTSLSGSSTINDFETMLQLVYLNFNSLREDQEAYDVFKDEMIAQLEMAKRNPMGSIGDSIAKLTTSYDIEHRPLRIEDFQKISYKRGLEIARERLAAADGFNFFFVGNIDIEKVKPLICKYLGSLNKGKATSKMDRVALTQPSNEGPKKMNYSVAGDTPMAFVVDFLTGKTDYNLRNLLIAEVANGVLDQVLVASIREREGGVYSPSANVSVRQYPYGTANMMVFFQCQPERAEQLNKVVYQELDQLVKKGVDATLVNKTITNMKKVYDEQQRKNGYWLGHLVSLNFFEENRYDTYMKELNSITPKDVQNFFKIMVDKRKPLELIMFQDPKLRK